MGGGSESVVDGAEDVRDDYVEVGYLAVGLLSRRGNEKRGEYSWIFKIHVVGNPSI